MAFADGSRRAGVTGNGKCNVGPTVFSGRVPAPRGWAGFTLVELMVTLGAAGILLALAVPAFLGLLERNRLETSASQMLGSLMLARSEALKRNLPVVVCKSADGAACIASGGWEQGRLMFADLNGDGLLDAGEDILEVAGGLRGGDTMRVVGTDFDKRIIYRADGTASGVGTYVICNSDEDTRLAREISVELTGRPRRSTGTADCTP